VQYTSAGTVEFLLDGEGRFYFLEMNTRLQVEHPVTEWVTGIDLVAAQLRVARGEPLGLAQSDVTFRGHAIEVRVCAEDAAAGFLPSAGAILALREPAGPGVRVDSGIAMGMSVPVEYDSLLAKISVWGPQRSAAVERLRAALRETAVLGPTTNLAFLQDVVALPAFLAGATHTGFVDEHLSGWRQGDAEVAAAAIAAALGMHASTAATTSAAAPATPPTPWETLGRWRLAT